MRRVLLLLAVVCSVVVSGGVASAQSIPADLTLGYLKSPPRILSPDTDYSMDAYITNRGGDAILEDGQTLISFKVSTAQILSSSCYTNSNRVTLECETVGNELKMESSGQSVIPKGSEISVSLSYKTSATEGDMETLFSIDPDNVTAELSETNNVAGPYKSFVGDPGETDLSVSVVDENDPIATYDNFGEGRAIYQYIHVRNEGNKLASNVLVTSKRPLSEDIYRGGANPSQGRCYYDEPNETHLCDLDSLIPGQTVTVGTYDILYSSAAPRVLRTEAKVSHSNFDPIAENDTAVEETTVVDGIAPRVQFTSGPEKMITSNSATFGFQADESGATFECSLDGEKYVRCTSPKTYSDLSNGRHRMEVRATDQAGNVGDYNRGIAEYRWTVKVPPNKPPMISVIPNQAIKVNASTRPVKFTVADIDGLISGVKLKVISSNARLVPVKNIVLGGTGPNRTIKVTPARNKTGVARITLTGIDGDGGKATRTFTVTVKK